MVLILCNLKTCSRSMGFIGCSISSILSRFLLENIRLFSRVMWLLIWYLKIWPNLEEKNFYYGQIFLLGLGSSHIHPLRSDHIAVQNVSVESYCIDSWMDVRECVQSARYLGTTDPYYTCSTRNSTCGIGCSLRMEYISSFLKFKIFTVSVIQLDTQLHVPFKPTYITLTS